MTKEEARDILENWINEQSEDMNGEHVYFSLPITDVVVYGKGGFEQWTFKGLVKLAYDLEDVR